MAAVFLLSGCDGAAPRDALSVQEILADISAEKSELDGRQIAVRGWLGQCGGLDCGLYQSLDDARTVAAGDYDSDEWAAAMDRRLAIGGGDYIDLLAAPLQFQEVVVYGEVNAAWHAPPDETGNQFGCWDRCDDIIPHSIEKVLF